jgi:hypothetical protein
MQKTAKIRRADMEAAESCIIFSEELYKKLFTWHRKCIMEIKLDYLKLSACRTYNSKEEKTVPGFKVARDRLIFLLGGNSSREHKLKLYLVYN